ncbi:MAG: MFS transporter [Alphaproteobacteria bacterium]|nr:MFS transporter [Alphaproteobacteria bacterium]
MKTMSRTAMPKGVYALGFVSMFMDISSEMIHSLLPLFLTGVLGASALSVGILEGIAEATASIVKIFSGAVSDWIGRRKPLLLLGYGLATLTKPLFPLADSFTTVLTARFLDRIGKGIRAAPRDAFLADITPEPMRGAAYGLRQSMDTTGAFIGPLAAMLLMIWTFNDYRTVFWIAVIPALIVILIIIFGIREPARATAPEKKTFPLKPDQLKLLSPVFWGVTMVASVLTLARFSEAFLILRGDSIGLDAAFAPAILIAMNVVYSLSAWPVGILSDRIGRQGLLVAGIAMLIIADIVLAYAHTPLLVYIGAGLWGLHMGLTQGIITAYIAGSVPAHLRGTGFGVYNFVTGVVLLLASVIAGYLWSAYGPVVTFIGGAAFSAISLLGFLVMRPIPGK